MKKGILILAVIFINHSCFSQFATPEMKKIFSVNQISDLKIINDYFQQSICGNIKKTNFNDCFKKEIPRIVDNGYDSIAERMDFEKQKELYEKISDSTFNEIWNYAKMWKKNDRETAYRYLGVTTIGKYKDFLFELGKKNQFIAAYHESFWSIGALPFISNFLYNIYENPEKLDLNDPNIQLIIAIHIMTDIDNSTRDELWEH